MGVQPVDLRPASSLPQGELAALFTAGYEDYYAPVHIDAAALAFMTQAWDLDLDASKVALRDGEPVGVCMLGLRGDEAWIGGLGVVVGERRGGLGSRLMEAVLDEARDRDVREVRLEVIRENERAIPLYERLGFERTRDLEVWSLPGAPGAVRETDAGLAHAWIREHRTEREPWQRDDGTLANLGDLTGLEADGGAAVVRTPGGRVLVLQIAGRDGALRELLGAARALGDSLLVLNLPGGHAAGAALRDLGGRVDVRQYEMAIALQPGG
jgi:ribosomal protein S18 acetylase RimI-like enzyme